MPRHYSYVYKYIDPRNDEVIYVGKGKEKRAHSHLNRIDNHPLTKRIQEIIKDGYLPKIEIYKTINNHQARFVEDVLIRHYGRKNMDEGPLLNLIGGKKKKKGHKMKRLSWKEIKAAIPEHGKADLEKEYERLQEQKRMLINR